VCRLYPGQREGCGLDLDEHPAEGRHRAIEIGRLGAFEVGEKSPDPGRQMLLEQLPVGTCRCRQLAVGEAGHDLAQDRGVVFRPALTFRPLDSKSSQVRAQARQWPLMQKPGEIIRAVGQEFPAPEPDEEIEIFALDALGAGSGGGLRKRRRRADWRRRSIRRDGGAGIDLVHARAAATAARIPVRARHRPHPHQSSCRNARRGD
jgi:hypothetical protein